MIPPKIIQNIVQNKFSHSGYLESMALIEISLISVKLLEQLICNHHHNQKSLYTYDSYEESIFKFKEFRIFANKCNFFFNYNRDSENFENDQELIKMQVKSFFYAMNLPFLINDRINSNLTKEFLNYTANIISN